MRVIRGMWRAARGWALLAGIGLLGWAAPVQGQTLYNFTDCAGGAAWNSSGGPVVFGAAFGSSVGRATTETSVLEDGAPVAHLATRPPDSGPAGPWFLEGVYSGIAIPTTATLARFESQIGFENGAAGSSGAHFSVWLLKGAEYYQLATAEVKYDSVLNPLWVDLTAYKGQTITLKLRIEAGADGVDDFGVWKDPKVVSYGTTIHDFVANANLATTWVNGSGGTVAFGAPVTSQGGALRFSGLAEDGAVHSNVLETRPDYLAAGTHSMRGQFPLLAIPASSSRIKFLGRVGLANGATGSDGVNFEFLSGDARGSLTSLGAVAAKYDGRLDCFSADLTADRGQSKRYHLKASAGASATNDLALWIEARIVSYDPVVAYDFFEHANVAAWSSGAAGSVSFNGGASPNGYAQTGTDTLEDGLAHPNCLITHPNYSSPTGFIQGVYDNVIIPSNLADVKFTATIGLRAGAASGDSAIYKVLVKRRGQRDAYCVAAKTRNGALADISGNLSGFQGQNVSIILRVEGAAGASGGACWLNPRIEAEAPMQLFAGDYGAAVNDGADDLAAANRAMELAWAVQPAEVYFGAGTYNLSNTLMASGFRNINLRGSAAGRTLLLCSNRGDGALYASCTINAHFRNFTIDYDPLPFTQGTPSNINVRGARGKGTFDVLIDPGYTGLDDPYFTDPNWRLPWDPNWAGFVDSTHFRNPENTVDAVQLSTWTRDLANPRLFHCTATTNLDGLDAYQASQLKFIYIRRNMAGSTCTGWNVNFAWPWNTMGHVSWDNVTVWSGPELTFVGGNLDKFFVRNCRVEIKPGSGRAMSCNGDGVNTTNCTKGPDVLDTEIHGQCDDGLNNAWNAYIVAATSDSTHLALSPGNASIEVGDQLQLFLHDSGTICNTVTVVQVSDGMRLLPPDTWAYDVVTSPSFSPAAVVGDWVYNLTHSASHMLIDGCTFSDYHGSGVLNHGPNAVVANNTIGYLPNAAVLFWNQPMDGGGYRCSGGRIENNTFIRCATNSWQTNDLYLTGMVQVVGSDALWDYAPINYIHDDIVIRNNAFYDWPRHAICVSNSSNVLIENNTGANTTTGHWAARDNLRAVLVVDHVSTLTVRNNSFTDDRATSEITGKIIKRNTPASAIQSSGNTYLTNLPPFVPEIMTASWYTGTPPSVDFTAAPLSGPTPLNVAFAASTSGAEAWAWDFTNDGAWESLNTPNPSYTYSSAGSFTPKLAGCNAYGLADRVRPGHIKAGWEAWTASAGFSASVQGANQWYYRDWNGADYADMTWSTVFNCWQGRSEFSLIFVNGQHPDSTSSARVWRAPRALTIRVHGNVRKGDTTGGDGVIATIRKRSGGVHTTIWGPRAIGFNDRIGFNYDFQAGVRANDEIVFLLERSGNSACDSTEWDPTIETVLPSGQARAKSWSLYE